MGFNAIGEVVGSGKFNITVDDGAGWPDLRGIGGEKCADMAGQVSFRKEGEGPSQIVSWVVPTTTPLACAERVSVTETGRPCKVTVGAEEASRISSIMTWGEGKVTRSSGTQTGTGGVVQKTGQSAASRVSLGRGLGLVASLFGVIRGLHLMT